MTLLFKRLRSYLPTKLPVGVTEFNNWADSIIELTGPFADADSMKFAIASQILHMPSNRSSCPKAFFVNSLRKAAANQVASQIFQDVKTRQIEAAKAEQERLANQNKVEVTTEVTSDEQQQKV